MLMSGPQQRMMFALMGDWSDDERHEFLEWMCPGVTSFTDVTRGDASRIIDALVNTEDPPTPTQGATDE